jgi:GLPGLI family protein
MKNIIILIIYILFNCNICAQNFGGVMPKDIYTTTNIDSGNIRIWYALNATDINKPETYDDWQRLEIGTNYSKYYSFFVFNNDSLVAEWKKKNPGAQGCPFKLGEMGKKNNWNEYHYSEYFKDFSKNIFTQYLRMPHSGLSNYQYKENIPIQNWEVSSDTLTVAGHLCQKATCTFRGRNFIAWFTMDIPIQNGPWKFGGLPGLILKVYDKFELYNFECTQIENFRGKYMINIYDYKNYIKIDRLKLNKLLKRMYDDYYNVAGWVVTNRDGMPVAWKKIPYNPIELE